MHIASRHLEGHSELTLRMPVRPELVESLDTLTHGTRLVRIVEALNGLRTAAREAALAQAFTDAVARVEVIHSFRLALLRDDEDPLDPGSVLLAVTFDGPWEPYVRTVWADLGPLLDVILCNCVDYPVSVRTPFEDYARWIRRHQVRVPFFYSADGLSVPDRVRLSGIERIGREQRDPLQAALAVARAVPGTRVPPANADLVGAGVPALALLALQRDMYPDNSEDGELLLRAAHVLLRDLRARDTRKLIPLHSALRKRLRAELEWFEQDLPPTPGQGGAAPRLDPEDLQPGVLEESSEASHAALLLMRVRTGQQRQARAWLRATFGWSPAASIDSGGPTVSAAVAFTHAGLRRLGVAADILAALPGEFIEGMAARAGLLGDVRHNHPSRWRPPVLNWPGGEPEGAGVPLDQVDFVVIARTRADRQPGDHVLAGNPGHPLHAYCSAIATCPGVDLLAVEAMVRTVDPHGRVREHFGFVDGISQPGLAPDLATGTRHGEGVAPGEWVLGLPRDRDRPGAPQATLPAALRQATFLVVRKIRQDRPALEQLLDRALATPELAGVDREQLLGKLMGRTRDGHPMAVGVVPDAHDRFDYAGDDGSGTPRDSHVRRANPRLREGPPLPRLLRRGMSYGPDLASDADAERGLMFIACNASIAEQFEVVQRWLTGSSPSGAGAAPGDPFLGVARSGDPRTYRYLDGGRVRQVDLDAPGEAPLTVLQWGMYLLQPSRSGLNELLDEPQRTRESGAATPRWLVALAQRAAAGTDRVDDWKALLDDPDARASGRTARLWQYVRDAHGGVLRTAFGVLVGTEAALHEVLRNDAAFSVCGYMARMEPSLGRIYLGLDSGPGYQAEATVANAAIGAVTRVEARALAWQLATAALEQQAPAGQRGFVALRALVDAALAGICIHWFDVPDGGWVLAGGTPGKLDPGTLHCPYHFTAPSRFIFSPSPGAFAQAEGIDHGARLRIAVREWLQQAGRADARGRISRPVIDAVADDDRCASALVGVMMGFLPTAFGAALGVAWQWVASGRLWALQLDARTLSSRDPDALANLLTPALVDALQVRPIPDQIWRTCREAAPLPRGEALPPLQVDAGERVVLGLASVTAQLRALGRAELDPMYGRAPEGAVPTVHGCPGMEAAMGVLEGLLAVLVATPGLRAGGIPLVLERA